MGQGVISQMLQICRQVFTAKDLSYHITALSICCDLVSSLSCPMVVSLLLIESNADNICTWDHVPQTAGRCVHMPTKLITEQSLPG
jgi:hypothetical protein